MKQRSDWLKVFPICLLLTFAAIPLAAQDKPDTTAIKQLLEFMYNRDQKTRKNGDSAAFVRYIDSTNLVLLENLISRYGWLDKKFVGARGNYIQFLVLQHAELPTQEKYLPQFEKSVADSQSRPSDLAMFRDRILMRQGKDQIYGTQVVPDKENGGYRFYPIENEAEVNERRKAVGLKPIEKYAEYFGINYVLPVKKEE